MLTYTTQLRPLILPQYGRNIQNMVDHCLTIADRDERTRCARSIVAAMNVLFPAGNNEPEAYRRKLWDHLMIMSEFRLDVDAPYPTMQPDQEPEHPAPLDYDTTGGRLAWRNYGRLIEEMAKVAADMPEGEERDNLVMLVANQMKKVMVTSGRDAATEDRRIFSDLAAMTDGRIRLDPATTHLHEYNHIAPVQSKKKRKK